MNDILVNRVAGSEPASLAPTKVNASMEPEFGAPIENLTTPAGREAVLSCLVRNLNHFKVSFEMCVFDFELHELLEAFRRGRGLGKYHVLIVFERRRNRQNGRKIEIIPY